MKKILLSILCFLCLDSSAFATTNTATKAGNWSDTSVWDQGHVPAAGEDVALAGYVITWDVATVPIIPATGSLGTITSTGTAGQIAADISNAACNTVGACKITATTITAGLKPTSIGILRFTGTTTNHVSVIASTEIHGGTDTGSAAISNATFGGTIDVTTPLLVGGSGGTCHGYICATSGNIVLTGHAKGGDTTASSHGISNSSTGSVTVSNGAEGGPYITCHGVSNSATGTLAVTGDITGGTGMGATGISTMTAATLTNSNLINGTGGVAYQGKPPTWTPGNTNYMTWYVDGANHNFYVDTDPGVANVKSGTTYYFSSGTIKTGTYSSGGGCTCGF